MWENLKKRDIIKLPLTYSDHDIELRQLTVAYIASKTSNLGPTDILIVFGSPTCIKAGLPKTSAIKVHWLAVAKRIHVISVYGEADDILRELVNRLLPECLAI